LGSARKSPIFYRGSIVIIVNDLRKDRQSQGVDLAMRKGIKFGRKHSLNNEQINAMRQKRSEGIKIADLVDEFKVSKASVYRCLSSVSYQQA
jgi:DNA invertase Pin-like site-specific DNA recombinase